MKIEQIADIATSSNHLPIVFSFLVGLFVTRKESRSFYEDNSEVPGDNVPATLIEGMGR